MKVLSLATNLDWLDWPLQPLHIRNVFLNKELEEVYITMLPRLCKEGENVVCKLKKSMYDLKQSPRTWLARFAKVMKKQGFQQG